VTSAGMARSKSSRTIEIGSWMTCRQ
jgi:hypothetical protein